MPAADARPDKYAVIENTDEKKRGPAALFQNAMTKKIPTSVALKPG